MKKINKKREKVITDAVDKASNFSLKLTIAGILILFFVLSAGSFVFSLLTFIHLYEVPFALEVVSPILKALILSWFFMLIMAAISVLLWVIHKIRVRGLKNVRRTANNKSK